MTDTIGMGWRFVRAFIGGPFEGRMFMVRQNTRAIAVVDREHTVGRYVLCNLGWTWHRDQP